MSKLWVIRDTDEDDAYVYFTESNLPDMLGVTSDWTEDVEEAKAFTDEQKERKELPRGRHGLSPDWAQLPRPGGRNG